LSIPPERIHLVKGSAAAVIPRLVLRKKIDVLVMGTVCRTGVAGFLMGNTAERVLGNVKCSVLTLKPDGFVTPVRLK
jgi:nucleotide-binding universal stress UspA family protein